MLEKISHIHPFQRVWYRPTAFGKEVLFNIRFLSEELYIENIESINHESSGSAALMISYRHTSARILLYSLLRTIIHYNDFMIGMGLSQYTLNSLIELVDMAIEWYD